MHAPLLRSLETVSECVDNPNLLLRLPTCQYRFPRKCERICSLVRCVNLRVRPAFPGEYGRTFGPSSPGGHQGKETPPGKWRLLLTDRPTARRNRWKYFARRRSQVSKLVNELIYSYTHTHTHAHTHARTPVAPNLDSHIVRKRQAGIVIMSSFSHCQGINANLDHIVELFVSPWEGLRKNKRMFIPYTHVCQSCRMCESAFFVVLTRAC